MIRAIFTGLLLSAGLFAQFVRVAQFPPLLKQYLELTDAQTGSILQANAAFQAFQMEKSRRMAQVHMELGEETAKATVDPMALGVRYTELEAIRRELQAEQTKLQTTIDNLLTAAQKTKVQALMQAARLQPVICEAQGLNVLGSTEITPNNPTGAIVPILSYTPLLFPNAGCRAGLTTGDFASFLLGGPFQGPALP